MGSDLEGLTGGDPSTEKQLAKAMKDFKGAAAGLKFADGGIELAFAGGGATDEGGKTVGKHVGALPKDTAAVVALAVPEKIWKQLGSGSSKDSMFSLGTDVRSEHRPRPARRPDHAVR